MRPGADRLVPGASSRGRAPGLPTDLQRYDCNMQREQALAAGKGLGPCLAPLVLPTVQRFRHTIDTETCGTPRIIPCRSASFLEGP